MCGGSKGDSGAAAAAAESERKRLEAERELEKVKNDQKMLAEKQAIAAKEASDSLRQRQLLGTLNEDDLYDPLTGKKKVVAPSTQSTTLLGS